MAIKRTTVTKQEFEEALAHLGLSVAECAKQCAIPRAYLSDLKNRDVPLRRDYDDRLREFLKGEGIEFDAEADAEAPAARKAAVREVRYLWPVDEVVTDAAMQNVQRIIEDNDARLAALLKAEAVRDSGFLGSGGLKKETEEALQEAGSILAENYVLLRMVRGWPALGVKASAEAPETLRDVLLTHYRPRLEEAELIEPEVKAEAETEGA